MQSVEVKVDAALIEQLRAGYAELSARKIARELVTSEASVEEKSNASRAQSPD
jgi:hypothetical protein